MIIIDAPLFDVFLVYYLFPLILIVGGIGMLYVKQNEWFGLRTPATLSDPEIWEKANKVVGIYFVILGTVLLFFNLVSYFFRWPILIQIGLMLILPTGIALFGINYSDELKKHETEVALETFVISKKFVYIMCFISIFMASVGIFLFSISSNIGVKIFGVGFVIVGVIFSYLFFKNASQNHLERTQNFQKYFTYFAIITAIWSLLSVAFMYLTFK